ncbi:MAG TPA: adenylate/guanylate cyclase domain-containing protein, partial [Nitriliruptorales bacterium]|nr:adenylate/guanylate cyclase domain-containing protein [Nitriliruptorales bacterium]
DAAASPATLATTLDPGERRLHERLLVRFTVSVTVAATGWVVTYLSLGLLTAAAIPFSYQVVSVASLVVYRARPRFQLLRTVQLALMLALPFALQWALGGFVASSAVALWALASPMGAVFLGARPWPWLAAFLIFLGTSGALEAGLDPAPIPDHVRATFFVLNLGAPSLTVFLLMRYFLRQRDLAREALAAEHRDLLAERRKSERLLLNVLPAAVVERLKEGEDVIADAAEVTVMFADIVGFTPLSGRLTPRQVVNVLNRVFSALDGLADRFGLEKIKTIGDAYMVVGGLPTPSPEHAADVADMALEVVRVVPVMGAEIGESLQVRVGIDRGPVVAGVIGQRRFSYDLWGDTVNTASRMESHGEPGRIQVTESVVTHLAGRYIFEERGVVDVKGKGPMRTWFLTERP